MTPETLPVELENYPGASNIPRFMGVTQRDLVLIVGDKGSNPEVIAAVQQACLQSAKKVNVNLDLPPTPETEFSRALQKKMLAADVILLLGSESWFHAPSWEQLYMKYGKRVAEGYGLQPVHLQRGGMLADYQEVEAVGKALLAHIKEGALMEITTEAGTYLKAMVGHFFGIETGNYRSAGGAGNLPPGELYILPKETSGKVVFDLNGDVLGRLDNQPVTVAVENNRVVEYSPHAQSFFDDDHFLNLAEIAFGINSQADPQSTSVLETEKVLGAGHCGFGGDSYFGGKAAGPHMDFIYNEVSLKIDGLLVIDQGRIV